MNLDSIMIHKNVDRVSSKFNRLKTAFIMIYDKKYCDNDTKWLLELVIVEYLIIHLTGQIQLMQSEKC